MATTETRTAEPSAMETLEQVVASRREHPSLQRIGGFSDGVYAFAITLLILGIRIPHPEDANSAQGLLTLLTVQWRSYLAVVISFTLIGITWANHRVLFSKFARADQNLVWLNLVHLFFGAAFIPIPTAVLGSWLGSSSHTDQVVAAVFYGASAVVGAISFSAVWWYGAYAARLTHPELTPERRRAHTIAWGASIPVMTLLTALAFVSPMVAAVGYLFVILVYVLPLARILDAMKSRQRATAK